MGPFRRVLGSHQKQVLLIMSEQSPEISLLLSGDGVSANFNANISMKKDTTSCTFAHTLIKVTNLSEDIPL